MSDPKDPAGLFEKNYLILKNEFSAFADGGSFRLCAAVFTAAGAEIDPDALSAMCFSIKERLSAYPGFMGKRLLLCASALVSDSFWAQRLENISDVCLCLRKELRTPDFPPFTAFLLDRYGDAPETESLCRKTAEIFAASGTYHPLLSGKLSPDFCAAFALSGRPAEEVLTNVENCISALEAGFGSDSGIFHAAAILGLDGRDALSKCDALLRLKICLEGRGTGSVGKLCLAPLACTVLKNPDAGDFADVLSVFSSAMRKKKGFGTLSLGRKKRLALCSWILNSALSDDSPAFGAARWLSAEIIAASL